MNNVEGIAQLNRALKELAELDMEAVVSQSLLLIEGEAKRNAPVLTGKLRTSYATQITEKSKDKVVGIVGTDTEYAPFVEFGTRHQQPQPHLRPAYDSQKEKVLKLIAKTVAEQIKAINGSH
jgi:HK97 gp10 family phage protein